MKAWLAVICFVALLIVFGPGCGGGGGGGTVDTTGSGSTNGGNIARYAVEATKNGVLIDPLNIVQGETVQFRVAGYTAQNALVVQSSSNWTVDATGASLGTMTGSGQYTANNYGPNTFVVSADSGGQNRQGPAKVRPPGQALVTGRIVDGQGAAAIDMLWGMQVDFYDAANNLVGITVAQGNGTFRASVPDTAVTFEVNKNSIRTGYYKEYKYGVKWFLPQGACRATLPAVTNGSTTNIGDILVPPTSFNGSSLPPPPPPSPCG